MHKSNTSRLIHKRWWKHVLWLRTHLMEEHICINVCLHMHWHSADRANLYACILYSPSVALIQMKHESIHCRVKAWWCNVNWDDGSYTEKRAKGNRESDMEMMGSNSWSSLPHTVCWTTSHGNGDSLDMYLLYTVSVEVLARLLFSPHSSGSCWR